MHLIWVPAADSARAGKPWTGDFNSKAVTTVECSPCNISSSVRRLMTPMPTSSGLGSTMSSGMESCLGNLDLLGPELLPCSFGSTLHRSASHGFCSCTLSENAWPEKRSLQVGWSIQSGAIGTSKCRTSHFNSEGCLPGCAQRTLRRRTVGMPRRFPPDGKQTTAESVLRWAAHGEQECTHPY